MEIKNIFKHRMTNTDRIAQIRCIDSAAAVHFWNQVCAATGHDLSTYDVLMLLLVRGEQASTISALELGETYHSRTQLEEPATAIASPAIKPSLSRPPETQRVIAEADVKNIIHFTRDQFGAKCRAELAEKHLLTTTAADELYKLLKDVSSLGFKRSKELSNYIVSQKLGDKYPNISGIVTMKEEGREWDFRGGFPPKIYAIICDELELNNQGTRARAVKFKSFKEMQSSRDISHLY